MRLMTTLLTATLMLTTHLAAQTWVAQGSENGRLRLQGKATYEFLGSEFSFSNEVVKGAPYSARAVTETIQVLGDGNRITRTSIARIFRDSEGRTRREQDLPAIGNWLPEASDHRMITISDPVEGTSYSLNPDSMQAQRMTRPNFNVVVRKSGGEGEDDHKVVVMAATEQDKVKIRESKVIVERLHEAPTRSGGTFERIRVAPTAEGSEPVTESLGTRSFDGIEAEGTRTVVTIPAGRIGNELPIEIVTERWHSPQLESVVMRRHYDPRFGETVYRLEDIDLSEPDPALFQVPAEFTIEEGGNSFIHFKKKLNELREKP